MITTESTYFADVQAALHELGQPSTLSSDERDVIDDYDAQGFGAKACAEHIANDRR